MLSSLFIFLISTPFKLPFMKTLFQIFHNGFIILKVQIMYFTNIFPTLFTLFPPPAFHSFPDPKYSSFLFVPLFYVFPLWILLMRENVQYLSFWVWHILLNMMILCSVHFPSNDIILFFFMIE
jgi:hypothetical protein